MKKFIFFLAVLLAAAWYGQRYMPVLQQQLTQTLSLIQGNPSAPTNGGASRANTPSSNTSSAQIMKCITAQGKVFYGDIPPNTHCERLEPIKGALSIVPAQPLPSQNNEPQTAAKSPLSGLSLNGISLPNPEALRPENRIPQE